MRLISLFCLYSLFLLIAPTLNIQINGQLPSYFFNNSKILSLQSDKQMIYNWINYANPRTHLLWRGSQNNFDLQTMHKYSDNWGPVIFLVKSGMDLVFGGYISRSLHLLQQQSYVDPRAFIFSVTKGTVHYQRNKTLALIYNPIDYLSLGNYEPSRSHWDDIAIHTHCDRSNGNDFYSYSDFGFAFYAPPGIIPGSTEAKNYLAGSYRYNCKELEIWALIDA